MGVCVCAMLDLVLNNKEKLVGNLKLKGNLSLSDHGIREIKSLRAVSRVHAMLSTLDFRTADFSLLRDLLARVPSDGTACWQEKPKKACL